MVGIVKEVFMCQIKGKTWTIDLLQRGSGSSVGVNGACPFRSIVKCFYFVKKALFCDTAICHSARVTEEFHEYKSDLDFIYI